MLKRSLSIAPCWRNPWGKGEALEERMQPEVYIRYLLIITNWILRTYIGVDWCRWSGATKG